MMFHDEDDEDEISTTRMLAGGGPSDRNTRTTNTTILVEDNNSSMVGGGGVSSSYRRCCWDHYNYQFDETEMLRVEEQEQEESDNDDDDDDHVHQRAGRENRRRPRQQRHREVQDHPYDAGVVVAGELVSGGGTETPDGSVSSNTVLVASNHCHRNDQLVLNHVRDRDQEQNHGYFRSSNNNGTSSGGTARRGMAMTTSSSTMMMVRRRTTRSSGWWWWWCWSWWLRNGKAHFVLLSVVVLVGGFYAGYSVGKGEQYYDTHNPVGVTTSRMGSGFSGPQPAAPGLGGVKKLFIQLSGENIARNIRRMSSEDYSVIEGQQDGGGPTQQNGDKSGNEQDGGVGVRLGTRTRASKSVATLIRDLWRSFGLSVRVESHKTNSGAGGAGSSMSSDHGSLSGSSHNLVRLLSVSTGTVVFESGGLAAGRSSNPTAKLFNQHPFIFFSPSGDVNGTLVYGKYGRREDFEQLVRSGVNVNGSVALVRFGRVVPSAVSSTACRYGVGGLVFYPDEQDFKGMPRDAVRWGTLATLDNWHSAGFAQQQVSKRAGRNVRCLLPSHTISFADATKILQYVRLPVLGSMNHSSDGGSTRSRGGQVPGSRGITGSPFPSGSPGIRAEQPGLRQPDDVRSATDSFTFRLQTFNSGSRTTTLYNVVAAIPGAWESDRYVIVGCSHDNWSYGAGDPAAGLSVVTEIAHKFSIAVQKGWRPRRSILFVSWDGHVQGGAGVKHFLQEHQFEVSSRAIAYVDVGRVLWGNQTLVVYSSPLLREVARKAVGRVRRAVEMEDGGPDAHHTREQQATKPARTNRKNNPSSSFYKSVRFSTLVTPDQPSFAFFGGTGVPFLRFCARNWDPQDGHGLQDKGNHYLYDYPFFSTSLDTYDNLLKFVEPKGIETLATIIAESLIILSDSNVLPMNVDEYVLDIQKAFGSFMGNYGREAAVANLSIGNLQAAVTRLEVIGDNFHTDMHNRSVVISTEQRDNAMGLVPSTFRQQRVAPPASSSNANKAKKPLLHRMMNDKLMEVDRSFLSVRSSSDSYRHQVIGYSVSPDDVPVYLHDGNANATSNQTPNPTTTFYFPKLTQAMECRNSGVEGAHLHRTHRSRGNRRTRRGTGTSASPPGDSGSPTPPDSLDQCHHEDWRTAAAQRMAGLTRALDAASAVLQTPLLPEESE